LQAQEDDDEWGEFCEPRIRPPSAVTPAKAGAQLSLESERVDKLVLRLRGDEGTWHEFETVNRSNTTKIKYFDSVWDAVERSIPEAAAILFAI
jgi:hypothetical protein